MTKQSEVGVIRTKMAGALLKGFEDCVAEGRNPGKIGHRILTDKAMGMGVKFTPRPKKPASTLTMKKPAVSAV